MLDSVPSLVDTLKHTHDTANPFCYNPRSAHLPFACLHFGLTVPSPMLFHRAFICLYLTDDRLYRACCEAH